MSCVTAAEDFHNSCFHSVLPTLSLHSFNTNYLNAFFNHLPTSNEQNIQTCISDCVRECMSLMFYDPYSIFPAFSEL